MPITPAFTTRVTKQLTEARPVTTRKMFGGLGMYHEGVFFGVCDDDKTFFKVDEQTVGMYDSHGMGPWLMGAEINDKYREVPEAIMSDPGELGEWIDAAVGVARRRKK
ncbi:MAG TPA: TfoX/Sxy family protein [Fimbriimonadaceae bacterium]|nr:TfoX/Sxy family protein [Fimbriimonadaceae bacterium]